MAKSKRPSSKRKPPRKIDTQTAREAGLSDDDLFRLLPREAQPGVGPEQLALNAALAFILRSEPATKLAKFCNVRITGPDLSQVPLDPDSVFQNYSACTHPASLYAMGVLHGAAAQRKYQALFEESLREREKSLAKGPFAAHGGEERYRQHVEDWKNEYNKSVAKSHTSKCEAIARKTPHRNLLKTDATGQPKRFTGRAVANALAGVGVRARPKR